MGGYAVLCCAVLCCAVLCCAVLSAVPVQVHDTPSDHVTRDYREGLAQLGDLQFRVIDTSGLEPAAAAHSLQVHTQCIR
jgi:hypothetical protein